MMELDPAYGDVNGLWPALKTSHVTPPSEPSDAHFASRSKVAWAKKSTAADVHMRDTYRVARRLSNGAVRSEIEQYCSKEWGVTPSVLVPNTIAKRLEIR